MLTRRDRLRGAALIGPPALWLAVFFVAPFAMVARVSLSASALAQPPYRPVVADPADPGSWLAMLRGLGVDNYRLLGTDALYWQAGLSSVILAACATAILAAIGIPVALAIARAPARLRPLLLAAICAPFTVSLLIRVYALTAILKPEGFLNGVLLALGVIERPLAILGTDAAILIGLVYLYLPFMVLPLVTVIERLDPALGEAAADLGATPATAFRTVTLPLIRPGLAAGVLLCFIPITGEFVVPDLLGGADTLMVGRVVWSEFFGNRDWPLAAALAITILAFLLGPIALVRRIEAAMPARAA